MKKTKITALMLSLVMLYSAAVPGTWATDDVDGAEIEINDESIVEEIVTEEETGTGDVVVEETTEPDTDAPETDEEEVPVEGVGGETNAGDPDAIYESIRTEVDFIIATDLTYKTEDELSEMEDKISRLLDWNDNALDNEQITYEQWEEITEELGKLYHTINNTTPVIYNSTPASGVEEVESEMILSKIVEKGENDKEYVLTLEAFLTGDTRETEFNTDTPLDIVLTVDLSASMEGNITCGVEGHTAGSSHHEVYAEDVVNSLVYYKDVNMQSPLYYCQTCSYWHDTNSCSGTKYLPEVLNHGSRQFFQNKDLTEPVDGKSVNYDDGYYVNVPYSYNKSDNSVKDYCYLKYCHICDAWVHSTWLTFGYKPTDTEDTDYIYTEWDYGHFNDDGSIILNHKRLGGTCWMPNIHDVEYVQFYKPCVQSRLEAAQVAIQAFLNQVYKSASGPDGKYNTYDDADHRVAITAFAGMYAWNGVNQRSGVYSVMPQDNDIDIRDASVKGEVGSFVPYYILEDEFKDIDIITNYYGSSNRKDLYQKSLRSVRNDAEREVLDDAVASLKIQYGTTIDYGVQMAKSIFEHNTSAGRNRVFVAFTDGMPDRGNRAPDLAEGIIDDGIPDSGLEAYATIWGDEYGSGEPALRLSKALKDQNIIVYSIGIDNNANDNIQSELVTNKPFANRTQNDFLHLLSSNYPSASTMNGGPYTVNDLNENLVENGQIKENANDLRYYLAASNATALINVFKTVANSLPSGDTVNQSYSLGTKVRDIVASQFSVDGGVNEIEVFDADFLGYDNNGKRIWKDPVQADYNIEISENTIDITGFNFSENYVGIHTKVEVGGNEVQTEHGKKLIIKIPIKVKESFTGANYVATNEITSGVYKPGATETTDLFPVPHVDIPTKLKVVKEIVGGISSDFDFEIKGLFGWDNTYTDKENDESNYLSINTDSEEGSLNVYDHSISAYTFTLGNLSENSELTKVIENVVVGSNIRFGELNNDLYTVSVMVGGDTITPNIDGSYDITVKPDMEIKVINTYKLADLTISKTGDKIDMDMDDEENQSFIFHVQGIDETPTAGIDVTVAVVGQSSVTISQIPVGEYTITEITDWSWRYELMEVKDDKKTISEENYEYADNVLIGSKVGLPLEGNTVTFNNDREEGFWLSGDSYCENWWKKIGEFFNVVKRDKDNKEIETEEQGGQQ